MSKKTKIIKDQVRRELTIERIVSIPLKYVWEGWTKPEHIARWWGPKHWSSTVYEMDVRPGGVWRYRLCPDHGDGEEAYCKAVYQEVIEPQKLIYIDSFTDNNWNIVENSEMYTTVTFDEMKEGSKLRIITRFNSVAELNNAEEMGMITGFTDAFDRLEDYLLTISGGEIMKTLISKDGTKIAYEKHGTGPSLILVSSAAADHKDAEQLAEQLATHFTVYNYDRRGRGQSTDSSQYAVECEVEDIEALITEAGGKSFLFGSSSGAVLALEAANRLGDKVTKLLMYEPPFIINDSRPRVPENYVQHLNVLIGEGKRSEAVEYFMSEALGIPSEFVEYMKAEPSWKSMEKIAHTLAYDGMVMGETQSGKPLPVDRWVMNVPTSVMVGEKSEPFFHDAAKSLVELLPQAIYQTLSGQDHSAVMMAPDVLASEMVNFFLNLHQNTKEVSI